MLGVLLAFSAALLVLGWPLVAFQTPDTTPRYAVTQAQATYLPWWVVQHGASSKTTVVSGNWRSLMRQFGHQNGGTDPIYGPYRTEAAATSHARRLDNGSDAWWTVNYGMAGSPNPGQVNAGRAVAPRRYCAANCHPGKHTSALGWGLEAGWLVVLVLAGLVLLARRQPQVATS